MTESYGFKHYGNIKHYIYKAFFRVFRELIVTFFGIDVVELFLFFLLIVVFILISIVN